MCYLLLPRRPAGLAWDPADAHLLPKQNEETILTNAPVDADNVTCTALFDFYSYL